MADSDVAVTPGSGAFLATYSFTEGSSTKQASRVVLSSSTGSPIANSGVVPVGGNTITQVSSITIKRPSNATVYAVGDLVANSTTAGSVTNLAFGTLARVSGGGGVIVGAALMKTTNSVTSASFRVHYFDTAPTYTGSGDNDLLSAVVVASSKGYLGYCDIQSMIGFSDVAWGTGAPDTSRGSIPFRGSSQTIYGLIEARGTYTPGSSETFIVYTDALQD